MKGKDQAGFPLASRIQLCQASGSKVLIQPVQGVLHHKGLRDQPAAQRYISYDLCVQLHTVIQHLSFRNIYRKTPYHFIKQFFLSGIHQFLLWRVQAIVFIFFEEAVRINKPAGPDCYSHIIQDKENGHIGHRRKSALNMTLNIQKGQNS